MVDDEDSNPGLRPLLPAIARPTHEPGPPAKTILPSAFASFISFVTSTSSLSLRVGGFCANAAIGAARFGTLGGLELGRVILEGLLFRAGQDVIETSKGRVGKSAAETLLNNALSSLHQSLTSTSFLVSAGFQLGSTSLSAGLYLSNALLVTIDSVLGDTETSKAIATIIVLIQREFRSPASGLEHVTLLEVLSGTLGFAVLQRWSKQYTERELKEHGDIQLVFDIVVVDEEDGFVQDETQALEIEMPSTDSDKEPDQGIQPDSRVPADRREDDGEEGMIDDGTSIVSTFSRRHSLASTGETPEQAFQEHLKRQLKPGSSVKVTSQSITKNVVTIEVLGDPSPEVEPPPGYSFVAVHSVVESPDSLKRLVFQNKRRKTRRGSFEVLSSQAANDALEGTQPQLATPNVDERVSLDLTNTEPGPTMDDSLQNVLNMSDPISSEPPIKANDKRRRSSINRPRRNSTDENTLRQGEERRDEASVSRDDRGEDTVLVKTPKKSSLRKTLRRGTSYMNLVDFWNGKRPSQHSSAPEGTKARLSHFPQAPVHRPASPISSRRPNLPRPSSTHSRRSLEIRGSVEIGPRPGSSGSIQAQPLRRRGNSSIYTLATTTSETSLMMHRGLDDDYNESLLSCLNHSGSLPTQYPYAPFTANIARFVRFSVAAYGPRFLQFTGISTDRVSKSEDAHSSGHAEHDSFTSHARLPPSTVILSSHIDPIGGRVGDMTSDIARGSDGLPLIHFVSLDHDSKAVVLTCRGTLGFEDILTDMTCDYEDLWWNGRKYQVHKGMLASARRLLTIHGGRMIATMKAALEEFQDYGIVICGHSLGGGVAALLGVMMSQPVDGAPNFVTAALQDRNRLTHGNEPSSLTLADYLSSTLPPHRPIHVYTYGPAATVSPSLQRDSKGLITTIVNGADHVPYLSIGTLRDFQSIALAFKHDTQDAKGEMRRRVWEGLRKTLRDHLGSSTTAKDPFRLLGSDDDGEDDTWPWDALQSLRASMTAQKLVPPGECFLIERRKVLSRQAFVKDDDDRAKPGKFAMGLGDGQSGRAFKAASHVRLTHVRDVARRFAEVRFDTSMWLDHIPARYQKACEALERGLV